MSRRPIVERARTLLFVPGNRPDRFDRAAGSDADLVVVDLEDDDAEGDKESARAAVASWLGGHAAAVRVNALASGHHDADVAVLAGRPGLRAVVVPMAEDPARPAVLAHRLGDDVAGRARDLVALDGSSP